MAQRALITGISGFAGGFLTEHLLDMGDAVLGCSPDGSWLPQCCPAEAQRPTLLPWDLADSEGPSDRVRRAIERFRPDVVYHLGALSVPDDCGQDEPSSRATAINVEGTGRVIDLAASLAAPARVVFISTSLVYGPTEVPDLRTDENAPLGPQAGYAKSKLAAEELAGRLCRTNGCDVVIARAFQHTGPRQSPRMMLPSWARQFAAGGRDPIQVHTLDARIDVTDVRDVVRAYRLLSEHGRRGDVYNVGSGTARTSGDVFHLLRELADPGRAVVETRPSVRQNPIADVTRLQKATGWKPLIPIEKTVADTFHWWQQQADGTTRG